MQTDKKNKDLTLKFLFLFFSVYFKVPTALPFSPHQCGCFVPGEAGLGVQNFEYAVFPRKITVPRILPLKGN